MNAIANTLRAASPGLYISPEMVTELAMGMDPPLDIAAKYGLEPSAFHALSALDWFNDAVYRRREELARDGHTFAAKAGMMAEEMWTLTFLAAKNGELKPAELIDAANKLTDIAGLKPKGPLQGQAGPAFQIVINVPEQVQGPGPAPMANVTPQQEAAQAALVLDLKASKTETLPDGRRVVSDLSIPGFGAGTPIPRETVALNADLAGPPIKE